ncbi:Lrp/AsnC family transcriptional regulator [Bacillus marasmi]|uniref:Lrp/AsnC family transcriptional regulator n=1 Tax=Bacillus marasmi TaxID=1926279 RepID=UPI0011CC9DDF|nr:Lrp/AsnC family transcriptional regulator [Bacillus marasmi]
MVLDEIDFQIIRILAGNSRVQWKEIGDKIHMTGQAVGNRIKKLEDQDVIRGYTVLLDTMKMGITYTAFVTVFMKTNYHGAFLNFIEKSREVVEAHKISGEGCFLLKVMIHEQEQLNEFLNNIIMYGNYKINLSIQTIKESNLPI